MRASNRPFAPTIGAIMRRFNHPAYRHRALQFAADAVLAAIAQAPNMTIERFELAVPSLNDIFIQVVEGERHA